MSSLIRKQHAVYLTVRGFQVCVEMVTTPCNRGTWLNKLQGGRKGGCEFSPGKFPSNYGTLVTLVLSMKVQIYCKTIANDAPRWIELAYWATSIYMLCLFSDSSEPGPVKSVL